jgi:ATP/maltotriose-dependent transcriptional regulator MalT
MTDLFQAGKDALLRGAWEEARSSFEASVALKETPEALEQLGLAAWWLDEVALTFESRERSYRLYRESGDPRGAARVAIWLVWDYLSFRGDTAVASGWLERARRLLTGHESSAEYGWLLLREGEVKLFRGHDPQSARDHGVQAAELGRTVGDLGLEFTGLALEGLALVSAGEVAAGMRRLDEATTAATAGELKEMHTVSVVCCWQIFACERVRDYDRAAQWCARVEEFSRRWRIRPLSAVCRTQYAGVLVWRGEWSRAEEELLAATRELEQTRPGMAGQVFARLADLRIRQGRLEEAEAFIARGGTHSLTRLAQAALRLDRGEPAEAAAELDRFLSQIGAGEATLRAAALELAVSAHAAQGNQAAAASALTELEEISSQLGTIPLAGSSKSARGMLSRSSGDLQGAAACFESAAELFQEGGAPFETARARLELAEVLAAGGERGAAETEARKALEAFGALGSQRYEARARACLKDLSKPPGKRETGPDLTGRQLEILRLAAQGLSNPDIAQRLKLSEHTVKRHVANLLTKLGLSSRAAAAAYAARHGLL